ncbi:MAG: DUF4442 domain-containing protein [Crocinitomicaceae bacterium]|jgi:acyl-coenzyme A thioesterase PaaI-like protein|nr:DUF4442 domain-containing protein [Crocinitomicaceae bacterium]
MSLRKIRFQLWFLGRFKIPLLGYTRPKIIEIDENRCVIRISLNYYTRNHLKSMYFGALAVGADTASGLHAFYFAEREKAKISFAFKAAKMEFLKRAESSVYFICNEGVKINEAFQKAKKTQERINETVLVEMQDSNNELVATAEMTLSIRVK